ncbi:MAG: ribbon-helix-helix domain-containing protein [Myxococcota bacterium]
MESIASRRTTVVLCPEDERALREASKREGLSQSELIRKGVRAVTAPYRRRARGWVADALCQGAPEIINEQFGDIDG